MGARCFDPSPLLALLPAVSDREIGERLGVSPLTVLWWRHGSQLQEATADRAAVALGLHPSLIWKGWVR